MVFVDSVGYLHFWVDFNNPSLDELQNKVKNIYGCDLSKLW